MVYMVYIYVYICVCVFLVCCQGFIVVSKHYHVKIYSWHWFIDVLWLLFSILAADGLPSNHHAPTKDCSPTVLSGWIWTSSSMRPSRTFLPHRKWQRLRCRWSWLWDGSWRIPKISEVIDQMKLTFLAKRFWSPCFATVYNFTFMFASVCLTAELYGTRSQYEVLRPLHPLNCRALDTPGPQIHAWCNPWSFNSRY